MLEHLEYEVPIDRRARYVKWLIFGVTLPLLPFAARWLAAWIDNASGNLSYTALLSDGELLVVATVIAAAVIGDLLFDFSKLNAVRGSTAVALMCAFSLLVVVISVLMFGLVTLDNQHRSDAVLQAEHAGNSTAHALIVQSYSNRSDSFFLSQQAEEINSQLSTALRIASVEISHNQSLIPGLRGLIKGLRGQVAEITRRLEITNNEGNNIATQLAESRQRNEEALVRAVNSLSAGRKQAALMSITMFLIAVVTGIVAILIATTPSSGQREQDRQRHAWASVTAAIQGHQKRPSSRDQQQQPSTTQPPDHGNGTGTPVSEL